MAKPKTTKPPPDTDERERPVRTMIALVVGFLAIVGIAVWTVLLPELADDAGEEEATSPPTAPATATPAPPPT